MWIGSERIAFAREGLHDSHFETDGVFRFQTNPALIHLVTAETGIGYLSKAPGTDVLAVAGDKELWPFDSLSKATPLRRIFGLGVRDGFLLFVSWAADDRIYFTVDDQVPLDGRHYVTKSRIASIKADGTDLKSTGLPTPATSFRYPANGPDGAILLAVSTWTESGKRSGAGVPRGRYEASGGTGAASAPSGFRFRAAVLHLSARPSLTGLQARLRLGDRELSKGRRLPGEQYPAGEVVRKQDRRSIGRRSSKLLTREIPPGELWTPSGREHAYLATRGWPGLVWRRRASGRPGARLGQEVRLEV